MQIRPDGGQCHGHDRRIEHDHEHTQAQDDECPPTLPTFEHRLFLSCHFASGGPLNSASTITSTSSNTPMVVPGAGMPYATPKSERFSVPLAENPMRACGSYACPA